MGGALAEYKRQLDVAKTEMHEARVAWVRQVADAAIKRRFRGWLTFEEIVQEAEATREATHA
jgi:hypothetical protein